MPKETETQALIVLGISKFNYHLAFFTKYGYPSKAACPWSVTPFRTHFLQGKAKKMLNVRPVFSPPSSKFCPFFLSRVPITAKRFRRLRTISTMCIKETRKILIEPGIQLIYFFEVNFMTNFGFKTSDKCLRLCLYVLNMSYISTTLYILLKKQFNSFSDKRVFCARQFFCSLTYFVFFFCE